jgi:hypothetical protein
VSEHEHHYIFLRQEVKRSAGWDDHTTERLVQDVFFCEGCLDYRTVKVRREVPRRDSFGWTEIPL